jgi:tungstate transport system substrate-binding protein
VGVKDLGNPVEVFKKIAKAKAVFVSRGDDSGTHKKEKKTWEKAGLIPGGNWYIESGQGMAETLRIANEKDGYTLSDRATFLTQKKNLNIVVLFENDKDLLNFYSVIAINPEKFSKVNYKDAKKFIDFITSLKGQKIIGNFKRKEFGRQIFIPDAITNK